MEGAADGASDRRKTGTFSRRDFSPNCVSILVKYQFEGRKPICRLQYSSQRHTFPNDVLARGTC
jgi:hypothetical protein